jgi:hypothetical protein
MRRHGDVYLEVCGRFGYYECVLRTEMLLNYIYALRSKPEEVNIPLLPSPY